MSEKKDFCISKLAKTAAVLEGTYYGKLTRVEEIIQFARRIGAKKIGIATCVGLIEESKVFAKLLEHHGFEPYGALFLAGFVFLLNVINLLTAKRPWPHCWYAEIL